MNDDSILFFFFYFFFEQFEASLVPFPTHLIEQTRLPEGYFAINIIKVAHICKSVFFFASVFSEYINKIRNKKTEKKAVKCQTYLVNLPPSARLF